MRITEAMFVNEIYEKFPVPSYLSDISQDSIEQLENKLFWFIKGARLYADFESSKLSEEIADIVLKRIIKDIRREI